MRNSNFFENLELQEVDDADDTVYEYGLPSEEEGGFIGTLSNLVAPARREVIKAPEEKQVPLEELGMDSIPGETMTVKTPGEYGPVETDFSYAPIVRGAKSVLDYGKKLFSNEQTQEDAVQALKSAPAAAVEGGGKFLEDQMAAAMGMSAGYSSVNRPDGEVARFDPLAFTGAVAPAGIAAVSSAKAGETVLGIFGGKTGKSFAKKEKAFENAVDEGLDPESIPDNLKDDDYFNKMFLDQDVFVKSGGAFRGEDGILRYEIPTRNVKLKTEEDGGVFESFDKANTSSRFMMFNPAAFDKLQKKKVKEVRDNPEKFIPEGRDINERYANGSLVYSKNDILEYTNPITLKDVLDFPELYSEYPNLGNLKFEFGNLPNMSAVGIIDLPEGASASYNPFSVTGPSIAIDAQSTSKNEIIKSILHEVQHAVDATEDRQFGASVQAYLPKNANAELEKIAISARIATKTIEGLFPPEKFGNLYPDTDNYKALRGLTNEDVRTIDLVRKLNSPEVIEKMRAKKPSPKSHAGKLIEAHDSMDDMQRIIINLYDEQMGEKYKKLTEVYQEAQRKYFSTPGEVDARNIEDRFDNPDQQIGGDMPILPTLFKDLPDDTGKTIQKDLSLTGSEDVGDIVFKSASKNTETIPVFPKPERMFPEGERPKGGKYLNPITGDDLTGMNVPNANIKINPDGKPSFTVTNQNVDSVGTVGKGNTQIKTNLFKSKAGWKWKESSVDTDNINTVISVTHKGKHYYTLETDFSKGVTLKNYPESKTEPKLRPTVQGQVKMGNRIGTISVRGVEHPVYDKVVTFAKGGLMARR